MYKKYPLFLYIVMTMWIIYVYCRHIAGVLLDEINHPPDSNAKSVTTDRESYSLAAGIALGKARLRRHPSQLTSLWATTK